MVTLQGTTCSVQGTMPRFALTGRMVPFTDTSSVPRSNRCGRKALSSRRERFMEYLYQADCAAKAHLNRSLSCHPFEFGPHSFSVQLQGRWGDCEAQGERAGHGSPPYRHRTNRCVVQYSGADLRLRWCAAPDSFHGYATPHPCDGILT